MRRREKRDDVRRDDQCFVGECGIDDGARGRGAGFARGREGDGDICDGKKASARLTMKVVEDLTLANDQDLAFLCLLLRLPSPLLAPQPRTAI